MAWVKVSRLAACPLIGQVWSALVALRLLLGLTEGVALRASLIRRSSSLTYTAGSILLCSSWFPRYDVAKRLSWFMTVAIFCAPATQALTDRLSRGRHRKHLLVHVLSI